MARPEGACLSEAAVAEALIAVVEAAAAAAASTVAGVATTTSEGEAAAAAAAEEDLDEGAAVEALISSKIKDLQNVSSY